jgi:NDP-sugar pyrophosphorylase family protein
MIVVVPMSGKGLRFREFGIEAPKPLIVCKGRWLVEWSLMSVKLELASRLIFIILKEHEHQYGVADRLRRKYGSKCHCLLEQSPTGAASTVLLAREYLDTAEDIIVKDCDGYLVSRVHDTIDSYRDDTVSGVLPTVDLPGDRWSFARTNEDEKVLQVAEKERISGHVIAGLYYFRHGHDFVTYAEKMMRRGTQVNGEFYVAPVYQEMIEDGHTIVIHRAEKLWDLGTPEAVRQFERDYVRQDDYEE